MVGCVIVGDGNIVGQGFDPIAGKPYAEVSSNPTFVSTLLLFVL